MNSLVTRFGTTALRQAIILGLIGTLLTGFVVAQAVTSTQLGGADQNIKLAYEVFTEDVDVTVTAVGILKVRSDTAAAGDSTGVEMDNTLPDVNNDLTKNHYAYRFEVKEAGVDALAVDENLKIEVYGDDGTTTELLATLYGEQGTADDVNVEGVTVTIDLGSTTVVHDTFDIIISRQ